MTSRSPRSSRTVALSLRLAAALAFYCVVGYAEDEDPLLATEIAPGFHAVTGAGGTIGLFVGDDGVIVIDDQIEEVSTALLELIAELTPQRVGWVINTHWHHDHTGGNATLGEHGARILSHDNVRPRLMTEQVMAPPMTGGTAPGLAPAAWPILTFSEEVTLHLNGDTIRVFHVPDAHTDGDAIVHLEGADVIHAGDVFFNGRYPNIDNGAGGTISGMIAALDRIAEAAGPATKIVAGHGPVGDRGDVEAAAAMLREVRMRVACLVAKGHSQQEAVDRKALADLDGEWAWFIDADRMTRHAYLSLTRDGAPSAETYCNTR